MTATAEGAYLRADFQKLQGQVTRDGLWLTSTEKTGTPEPARFRVIATALGRRGGLQADLPLQGTAHSMKEAARFDRPRLYEEYRVGMDGIRQDFVVLERPPGNESLQVELSASGAEVESAAYGAKLILSGPKRAIAYSQLHVSDATGRTLTAKMEVPTADKLIVSVDDSDAVYPVRIDPTFSDADWVSMGGFPGANDEVYALVADGAGNLYAGGDFTAIGNVLANHVAMWDGSTWSPLGTGTDDSVFVLAASGSALYAGGYFTTAGGNPANNIAVWNGASWAPVGSGIDGEVYSLLVSGNDLYAGGAFSSAGGTPANNIAVWNGTTWSALGAGITNDQYDEWVGALVMYGGALHVGGSFTQAGGADALSIARWDGGAWSALGDGLGISNSEPNVAGLAVMGNELYAAGSFSVASGVPAENIAKWNGAQWTALGAGVDDYVYALAASDTTLYVGGFFSRAGGQPAEHLAAWDGSAWSQVGNGTEDEVSAILVLGNALYVGGGFIQAGELAANYIAKWENDSWSSLGSGFNASVQAVAISGSTLYVGGTFLTAGNISANYVARWDGSTWSALGSGVNDTVRALAIMGGDLYAGGEFTMAGENPANHIARWSGSSWSSLGSGVSGGFASVRALAAAGTELYAGGMFTDAGGITANHIARWNGNAWSALSGGVSADGPFEFAAVSALAVSGLDLYAGGTFGTAGGITANNIARWDGTGWYALGSGVASGGEEFASINALVLSGASLYAGGFFTEADGVPANNVARWDGTNWWALASGIDEGEVRALVMLGSELFVGGSINSAGGVPVNNIAKWDGTNWWALGSGTDGRVSALGASGPDLYVGGNFDFAGEKVSPYLALARLGSGNGQFVVFENGRATVYLSVPAAGEYEIQRSLNLNSDLWTTLGMVIAAAPGTISYVDQAPPAPDAFYRAVRVGP